MEKTSTYVAAKSILRRSADVTLERAPAKPKQVQIYQQENFINDLPIAKDLL